MKQHCRLCRTETEVPTVQLGPDGHAAILCPSCMIKQLLPELSTQEFFATIGGMSGLRNRLGSAWLDEGMPDPRWEKLWQASLEEARSQAALK